MPRYHFNIYDGQTDIDVGGSELPSLEAARLEALKVAGEIIRDAATRRNFGEAWRLEVTDHAGLMLFRMDFVVAESPATAAATKRI